METAIIADDYTRNNQAFKNMRNVEEGRVRKQYSLEDTRWECPACGRNNNVSIHTFSDQKWEVKDRRRHRDDWDNYNEFEDQPDYNEFDDLEPGPDNVPFVDPPDLVVFQPVITPRIYHCRCSQKVFYWREGSNLKARFVGKYEDFDELAFASDSDPWKFYTNLKTIDPKQTQLF